MIRFFLGALFLLLAAGVRAQPSGTVYNQTDAQGRRNGQWIERFPARMGEEAFAEWGSYNEGRKFGPWYRYDGEARVVSIENFKRGVRDGEAKYFENGTLVVAGNFRGLNPDYKYDTIWVLDPVTDVEHKRVIPTEQGSVRHGFWRYYDPRSGRLIRELDYVLDEVVDKKEFSIAPVDSAWYKKREAAMPHMKNRFYKPPRGKQVSYTNPE
jgi:antitoxin component YwqK of YwqJK toxin-antitoxin module